MIPIARPWLGEEELDAVRRPLESGWVTQGPEVAAFEREFAAFVGAEHACAVSSCTTALHAALLALGVGEGDEVITVSHSFIATANVITYVGARPVFVDIRPGTYNMAVEQVKAAAGEKTRAILAVHQMGMPCDLAALAAVAEELGVPLIEDAACATGSEIEIDGVWQRIGKPVGDVACFSFHPRKLLTTGDGGMLTTNDPTLDEQFRLIRQHGMSISDLVRHKARKPITASFVQVGYNFRLTDIQAAIGRVQLGKIPAMVERRRLQAGRYRELLNEISPDLAPCEPTWARSNWQSYPVRLPEGADQIDVVMGLKERGVSVRTGIMNAHQEPAYDTVSWRSVDGGLPESERARDGSILLPIFHQLTEDEQQQVVSALRDVLKGGR